MAPAKGALLLLQDRGGPGDQPSQRLAWYGMVVELASAPGWLDEQLVVEPPLLLPRLVKGGEQPARATAPQRELSDKVPISLARRHVASR